MKINKPGLYVHIPFCEKICSYCSFTKYLYNENFADRYLKALEKELHKYDDYTFSSIYIGGGTPTSLNLKQLENLFILLENYKNKDTFINIESNPFLDNNKINILKKYGVNRISIGIQTFNKDYQKIINRVCSYDEICKLIKNLREHGIKDINVDLIYGFDGQDVLTLKKDLDLFTSLNINHISTYCLQIEKHTVLFNKNYSIADDEVASNLYKTIVEYLTFKGFNRYEVSNFSKPGFESQHNLIYWDNLEYGGVGVSASSYINGVRKTNTRNFNDYLNDRYEDYEEVLSISEKEFYFIMLGLRKINGFSLEEFKKLYNIDFLIKYKSKIDNLIKDNLLIVENGFVKIPENSFFIMDFILRKILF